MPAKKKPSKTSVKTKKPTTKAPATHAVRKWFIRLSILLIIIIIAAVIGFKTSPWPGALVIRYVFEKGGKETSQKLEKHVPSGIASIKNEQYKTGDKDAYLDVYYPDTIQNTDKVLPTIVWIHGGAWISGSKDDVRQYLQILASYGYTTVGINYTIAPEKHYPAPLLQANEAFTYLQENSKRLHIDPYTFVLAGDSAGSQIASQFATLVTNQPYAQQVGIDPTIQPSQLRGMVLNCGAYDLATANTSGEAGKFLNSVLWAYSGTKDFRNDQKLQYASVINYVTDDFPPTFITAGNADPLESQSLAFADKLQKLKVTTNTLFYPDNHTPKLPHEYQFNLDNADGRRALSQIVTFLGAHTKQN